MKRESPRATAVLPSSAELPLALTRDGALPDELGALLAERPPALFLDYDGTLTPIVDRPEGALLADETRQALRRLAARCPVAIVSGRALDDARTLVGLEELYYAGSHGFRIAGPSGAGLLYEAGQRFVPALDRAQQQLQQQAARFAGAQVERKEVAVALHYRRVAPEQHEALAQIARDVAAAHVGELALSGGKMVFELRPDVDWHKGRATLWLLERFERDGTRRLPIFIGDDVTDEDGFAALAGRGVGILVREPAQPRPSAARYALEHPGRVRQFLEQLERGLARGGGR